MSQVIHKHLTDLGAAAYIMMHKFKVVGKNGKAIYFEVGSEKESKEFEDLAMEYLTSEFHRFDACLMSLKKIGEYLPNITHSANKHATDLGAAAYIMMHKFKVIGKKGKAIYFEVAEEKENRDFEDLSLEYLTSEFHRFDACLMSLKKIGEYLPINE